MQPPPKKKPPLISRLFFSKPGLFLVGWLANMVFRLLYSTLRISTSGLDALTSASQGPLIVALWHDQLLLGPILFGILRKSRFSAVISNSRDGQMLASFIEKFSRVKTIPVAHSFRHGALRQMMQAINDNSILIITPDGPRGPRHVVKGGIIFSAQTTKAPIVAMHWKASSCWQLKTWDKLAIPKPFSKVVINFEPSLICPKESSRASLQEELTEALMGSSAKDKP